MDGSCNILPLYRAVKIVQVGYTMMGDFVADRVGDVRQGEVRRIKIGSLCQD